MFDNMRRREATRLQVIAILLFFSWLWQVRNHGDNIDGLVQVTLWGRDKMATIFGRQFQTTFFEKFCILIKMSLNFVP